jgi:hypothetical protein
MQEMHSEEELEDAVPEEWKEDAVPQLFLASRTPQTTTTTTTTSPTSPLLSITGRAIAYMVAAGWPFLAAWIEFLRLDASHAVDTNSCSEEGCSLESHIFLQQAMNWMLVASIVSVVVTAGLIHLRRAVRARRPASPASDAPVSRLVVAGLFITLCALAFLVGILRGAIISHFGR